MGIIGEEDGDYETQRHAGKRPRESLCTLLVFELQIMGVEMICLRDEDFMLLYRFGDHLR